MLKQNIYNEHKHVDRLKMVVVVLLLYVQSKQLWSYQERSINPTTHSYLLSG